MRNLISVSCIFLLLISVFSCKEDEKLSQKTDIIKKVTGSDFGESFTDENGNTFEQVILDNGQLTNMPITRITYSEPKIDLGEAKEGDKVRHSFEFKNTGHEPLIIQSAKGSCGCTVPNYSKIPVAPGEFGYIDIEFDSKGRLGVNNKEVTIIANTNPSVTKVSFSVKVIPND